MTHFHEIGGGAEVKSTAEIAPGRPGTAAFPYVSPFSQPRYFTELPSKRSAVRFPQDRHEALFRSHLKKFNCFVEQGKELVKFEQHDDHVVVYIKTPDSGEEIVHCQWLVGSDGAHSIVRKQLAIPFVGTTEQERQMLIGDILIHGGLDREVG